MLEEKQKNSLLKENWDAFSFGTLAQRTKSNRDLLYDLLEHLPSHDIFYDVNIRQGFYQKEWIEHSLKSSTIVKLNDEEAVTLSNLLLGKMLDRKDFCQAIFNRYSLKIICITLGENGSIVYDGIDYYHVPGIQVEVVDTVGAGDGYSAAFLFSFLSGASLKESALFANQVGGYVASQAGAVPEYTPALRKRISNFCG